MMTDALIVALSYLLGSIPTGFILTKLVLGADIRSVGSGATGATNTLRALGWKWGVVVLLIDLLKGIGAVLLARWLDSSAAGVALAGALAVAGHCWPVWLRFKGGKGVAAGAGAAFALSLWALWLIPILILPVVLTRYVSLGSIVAALSAPAIFGVLVATDAVPAEYLLFALPAAAIVVFQHRGNIARLRNGTERRLGRKAGAETAPAA